MALSPASLSKLRAPGEEKSDFASSFHELARMSASVGSVSGDGFSGGGAGGFAVGYHSSEDPAVASSMSCSGLAAGNWLLQWGAEEAEFRLADGDDAVVSFGTTWCGPCAILAPELLALANALDEDCDRVDVAKVDAEEADKLATAFGIEAYPTTLWLRDGREVHRLEGSVPAAALVQLTARHLLTAEEEEVMRANQPTWFVGPADA